jgi:hypothetical protein
MLVQHATPSTLDESQDQLLLAGSKITFTDIYNKEMDIPLVKGKFYRADDVDNTFILLNGVLTDVSQQAFRKHKQMIDLQEEVSNLRDELARLETERALELDDSERVQTLWAQVDTLQNALAKREVDLKTLAIASKKKIAQQDAQIQQLNQEADEMGNLIEQLVAKIQQLEASNQ